MQKECASVEKGSSEEVDDEAKRGYIAGYAIHVEIQWEDYKTAAILYVHMNS
jgi:hypothetical protein